MFTGRADEVDIPRAGAFGVQYRLVWKTNVGRELVRKVTFR